MALTGMLVACGTSTLKGSSRQQSSDGQANSSLATPAFNGTANATAAGLQIHTTGVQCGAFLLLKDPKATYTQAEIQAISKYVAFTGPNYVPDLAVTAGYLGIGFGTARGGQAYNAIPFSPSTVGLPSSLKWVPGGESCFDQLEVTNVSSIDLVISSVGATLTRNTVPNGINYQLLDVCTLPGHACSPPGGAEPGCLYTATIGLTGGHRGDHVDAPLQIPQNGRIYDPGTCVTPLMLAPHQSQEIDLIFSSKPQHLVYDVNLTMTINGKRSTFPSALDQSLVFVDDTSQFSCYAYQNLRFVIQQPIKLDFSNDWTRYCV